LGGAAEPRQTQNVQGVPSGFEKIRESGDGDCLFHAIARQALGDTTLAGRARRELCDWMEAHLPPSKASPLSDAHRSMIWQQRKELWESGEDGPALRYIQDMQRPGVWGTGLEAMFAAYHYGRPVHIWSPGGFSELRSPTAGSTLSGTSAEPIYLQHNGRNHWDSLRALPGAAARPRDTEHVSAADEELALAMSLSLVASFPEVVMDEREQRRAAALAAAEQRGQQQAVRGIGTSTAAAKRAVKPSVAVALSAAAATAKPAEATAAPNSVAASGECDGSSTGAGRWNRRQQAQAAESAPGEASCAAPSAAPGATPTLVLHQPAPADASAGFALAADAQTSAELERALTALQEVGLSPLEASEALVVCNGDLGKLKELYCIDWDDEGRTLQMPYTT